MSILVALAQAIAAPPPPAVPSHPVVVHGRREGERHILTYRASAARCGGEKVAVAHAEPAIPREASAYARQEPATELQFRIDGTGRPLGITRAGQPDPRTNPDLLPSFAAWRFDAGDGRQSCTITFYPIAEPVSAADDITLAKFAVFGQGHFYQDRALLDRFVPEDSNCLGRWPQLLTQVSPRFAAIPRKAGTLSLTTIRYGIDADGHVRDAQIAATSGNDALDAAGLAAIANWEYAQGPREGCVFPYGMGSTVPLTPPEPPVEDRTPCPFGAQWQTPPRLTFPEPYRRRGIEGWAIVEYDVAPWGEIGNARVLAAEPTSEFGVAALRVVRSAKKQPSSTGASGCTDRVMFKLGTDDTNRRESDRAATS